MSQKFPKSVRLLQQSEFDRVFRENRFAADRTLVINAIGNHRSTTRLGLSIGKRVGNAVCRNRWKRIIRESFRLQRCDLPSGLDVVVRPRKDAECEFDAVFKSLNKLLRQIERRLNKGQKP